MKSLFLNVLWLKLYFVWAAVLLWSESSQYHKRDWNNWNLNRHFILLGLYPPCPPQTHTHTHTHIDADKYTHVLHCQVFLIPGGSECRNPPTPNQWSARPRYPFVHPLRRRNQDEDASEKNSLRVYARGLYIMQINTDCGLGLAPLWHSDMYLRVWLCLCVSVCAHLCVFAIIF